MRKVVLLVFMILLLCFPVSAQYSYKMDSFDNTSMARSDAGPIDVFFNLMFIKKFNTNDELRYIAVSYVGKKHLSTDDIKVKVDDKMYNLPIFSLITEHVNNAGLFNLAGVVITPQLAQEIYKAQSVSMRITFSDNTNSTFDLPSGILLEWKKVILTNKDGTIQEAAQ